MVALPKDYIEFIQLLNKNKVKYLVVGGYAVAIHGYPRFTGDIDFWVKPEKDNAENIVKTLKEFGFASIGVTTEDLLKKDMIIQLGYQPLRIDLITDVSGLTFDECWNEKKVVDIAGEKVNFVNLYHLKINKEKSGRDKDKDDLKNLP